MNARSNTMQIENAVISSIFIQNGTGYVTITYDSVENDQVTDENFLILLVGRNTVIRDQFGRRIGLRNLKEDMVINAVFSSAMTRSNPPQARAYRINVVKENEFSIIEEGHVLSVENYNGFYYILTGYEDDIYSQIRYVISETTKLRGRYGNRISIRAIRPGQIVRIERASFQTASIPPQTNALTVQILY
ncbi:hypothetical protein [Anaerovorax sp. IOR16]|uniref:hypothetical protein n=1 Tax=Anaerovorax sp. IOR16 TaxID=2773458 RepID=UPI001FD6DC14|nr:hypothetical protein [Anaerovorax sp. IOR16]